VSHLLIPVFRRGDLTAANCVPRIKAIPQSFILYRVFFHFQNQTVQGLSLPVHSSLCFFFFLMINFFAAEDRRSKQGNSGNIPIVKLSPDTAARAGIHVKVKVWQLRSGTDYYERENPRGHLQRKVYDKFNRPGPRDSISSWKKKRE